MKKVAFILLLLCFSLEIQGQESIKKLRKLEPDPYQLTERFRRIEGIQSVKLVQLTRNGREDSKPDTLSVSTYDTFGNEIKKIRYDNNKASQVTENRFDKNGNRVYTKVAKMKTPNRADYYLTGYDAQNNVTDIFVFSLKDKDTLTTSAGIFSFENGQVSSKKSLRDGQLSIVQDFTYDQKGNLTQMHTGRGPNIGSFIDYTYNDKNQIIKKAEYSIYKEGAEPYYLSKSVFVYDDANRIVKDSVYRTSQNNWMITDYLYNEDGTLSKMNIQRDEDYRNVTYTYQKGQLVSQLAVTNERSFLKFLLIGIKNRYATKLPIEHEQQFTYDKKGRIISCKIFSNGVFQMEYLRHYYPL